MHADPQIVVSVHNDPSLGASAAVVVVIATPAPVIPTVLSKVNQVNRKEEVRLGFTSSQLGQYWTDSKNPAFFHFDAYIDGN